ncbi:MAG: serine hydrolase domain-containing protein, partial [Planctomycetota bacterium]
MRLLPFPFAPAASAQRQEGHRDNQTTPSTEQLIAKLDAAAAAMQKEQHIPGLAVIVVEKGKTRIKLGYGFANVEAKRKVDPDSTIFRIGSISKAVTLLAVSRLIDQGRIQASQPVREFGVPIQNPYDFAEPVTVNHLLTHTSGFDQIGVGRQVLDFDQSLSTRKSRRPSLRQFLSAGNLRLVSRPGSMIRYDTYGTTLAGVILESVTKQSFREALRKELFAPLGMNHSFVEVDESHLDAMATGYRWLENEFEPRPYEIYMTTPASSIDATPADMGRLLEALTADGSNASGRLFSPEMNATVLAPQFRAHPELVGTTHGLFESTTAQEGNTSINLRTVGHGGTMDGFRSAMTIIPERNLGVFLVANRSPDSRADSVDFRPLLDVVIESLDNAPEKKAFNIPETPKIDLAEYAGPYYYGVFCHTATSQDLSRDAWRRPQATEVTVQEGRLKIRDEMYLPRGEDVFVEASGRRLVYFGRDESGTVSHFVYSTSSDTFERELPARPHSKVTSFAQRVFELATQSGPKQALEFARYNADSPKFYVHEQEMNRAGYLLMEEDRLNVAIELFKLNVLRFPESWNAFDSLGEAY